ncbi:FixH family protein [Azoarcus sp. KH32C]|uniref:FixH family protein n=1 Tax=Azoarcus sp. KH32C TaxID=748247 RepID=UPI0005A2F76B|nr:FixH family protein [Azoarcus sp. KH32C]
MRLAKTFETSEPWYRHGWLWFLISIPAVAVVTGLVTLWLAVRTADGLVVDDYYQEGKTIQKTIARTTRAAELGLAAEVTMRADEVSLQLSAADGVALPETLLLTIAHPTRSGMDQALTLRKRDGAYVAPLAPLVSGHWLLQLEDDSRNWRMTTTISVPVSGPVRMVPSAG